MRIAYFLNDFPVLSQTFILNQITGLIDLGVSVDIFAYRENSQDTVHEIVNKYKLLERVRYLHELPLGRKDKLSYFIKLLFTRRFISNPISFIRGLNIVKYGSAGKWLQLPVDVLQLQHRMSYDVIHCQFGTVTTRVLNLIEVGALSGKLVTSFRGYDATNYARQFPGVYNKLFKCGNYFLPVSHSLKLTILKLGCPPDKITILHSGIMTEKFVYKQKRCPELGQVKVVTVARLVEKKGVDIAISSIAKVRSEGIDVQLSIIGDGPLRDDLGKLAQRLGVAENVSFLGWKIQDEVLVELNNSHILIAPSITADNGDQEGIPNVMKEAMAVGLPVIGTEHGGIPELIKDGESGFLVPEKDNEALAERIIYLCQHPEIWPVIGQKARQVIEQEFDSERINEKLLAIYKSLLH